jgi:elongation factor P hydroxylase
MPPETEVSAGSEFSSWCIAKMKKSRTLSFGYWIIDGTIR